MHQRSLLAFAITCAFGSAAWAAVPASGAPESPTTPAKHAPFASAPVSAAVLASKRGGDAAGSGTQLTGAVTGNQATNVVTGGNSISDGAFAGASGVSTVIQNSGNNVLIQNATIVNVQMK